MKNTLWAVPLCIAMLFGARLAEASVILQITSAGILTGARNVDVSGVLYDVTFVDGSCDSLFGGCDPTKFDFQSADAASAASAAVLKQLFVDGPQGPFAESPSLTSGCQDAVYLCIVLTPYDVYTVVGETVGNVIATAVLSWGLPSLLDEVTLAFPEYDYDTGNRLNWDSVYARWTPSSLRVPEPGSLALLGVGLFSIAAIRRRKPAKIEPERHIKRANPHIGTQYWGDLIPRSFFWPLDH